MADLLVVRRVPKTRLIGHLLKWETGEHVNSDDWSYVKVRALKIEPDPQQSGHMDVDGESIPYEPTWYEVHPSLLSFVAPRF